MNSPTPWLLLPVLLFLATACGNAATPASATTESTATALPVMTVSDIQAELDRVAELNQVRDLSTLVWPYDPTPNGIDARNGRVLALKYICWDICPDIGAYFLVYPDVPAESDCRSVNGRALFAPTPVPGPYTGCRAVAE